MVLWLPDMPADLWRMKELPKGFTLRVYSRMKDQLLGLVRCGWADEPGAWEWPRGGGGAG